MLIRCRRVVSPKNKAHSPCTSFNQLSRVAACGTQRLPRCVPRSHYPFLLVGDMLTKGMGPVWDPDCSRGCLVSCRWASASYRALNDTGRSNCFLGSLGIVLGEIRDD